MTEHKKIPVPEQEPAKRAGATLIERVVRNYDLIQLAPAPIPANLVPPASTRRRYRRADEVIEEAVVSPVAAPVPTEAAASTPAPEVVEGEVIAPTTA